MKRIRIVVNCIHVRCKWWLIMGLALLQGVPMSIFADDDPFGSLSITSSNVVSNAGATFGKIMEYASIIVGGLMILGCIINLIIVARRSSAEKQEHGDSAKTIFINLAIVLIGLGLIGLGWKGASYLAKLH